jgi:hypothetical protein
MANPEHLAILQQGVKAWNEWRDRHSAVIPDVSGADLRHINLSGGDNFYECLIVPMMRREDHARAPAVGADFRGVNCKGSILWNANLAGTVFSGSDLENSDLRKADLTGTTFDHANLKYVSLDGAIVSGTRFVEANLLGANLHVQQMGMFDLTGSNVGYTKFGDLDFRRIVGLDTLTHEAPSAVPIRSLYRSDGRIPEPFLRGTGIPEPFVAYMKTLVAAMGPSQFDSCFISYSAKDQDFAERLHGDLQKQGVRCWFAPHDIQAGRKIHEQIDEAVRLYDRLLLILSEHSMNSEWVKTEIAHARQKELNEGRQVLFPISLVSFEKIREWKCFDADTGTDSAREIREYFIPDFSNWKDHDSDQAAFQRLVSGLNQGRREAVGTVKPDSGRQ